jgi:hypothetical protein
MFGRMSWGRLILGILLVSLAAVAADRVDAAAPPGQAGMSVAIVGGSTAQRQLARLTAMRVGGVTIRRVRFHSPGLALRREHVRGSELEVFSSQPITRPHPAT